MIRIYPHHYPQENINCFKNDPGFHLVDNKVFPNIYYTKNAKAGIHAICRHHSLSRDDEVAIFTTTDKPYVSTCVSATLFNYAKISRVFTKRTRIIYVIHEFGEICAKITELRELADRLNIPLIEDCAHSPISGLEGAAVGSWGDYCIFSLSKHLPIESGGAVASKHALRFKDQELASDTLVKSIEGMLGILPSVAKKRIEIFKRIASEFSDYEFRKINSIAAVPYFAILKTNNADRCYIDLNPELFELGRTYNTDWVCIPTQPYAPDASWHQFFTTLRSIL